MSNIILKLIASSPTYIPDENVINRMIRNINESVPTIENISYEVYDEPRFIDPGSNWERVICPHCDAVIDSAWWQSAMDKAYENKFRNFGCVSSML